MKKTKIFYDGLCKVCSTEINQYKKMAGAENLNFVDITEPEFNPLDENLDPYKINIELHAIDTNGTLHAGVDTFILIWNEIHSLQWLARLAQKKPVKMTLNLFYFVFIKIRPYLPRKSCETSPYCAVDIKKINS